jgi:hypothetical protein
VAEPVAKQEVGTLDDRKNFQSMLAFSLPVLPLLATLGIIAAYEIGASGVAKVVGAVAVIGLWPVTSYLARGRTSWRQRQPERRAEEPARRHQGARGPESPMASG